MSRKILTSLLLSLVFACGIFAAADAPADVTGRPHDLSLSNEKGHCINCHDLHQTKLGQGFDHNLKRANEIAVCYQCHAGAFNSYSSIDPSYPDYTNLYSQYDIRGEFNQAHIHFPRYGMDGEHNKCSYCHNPHGVFNHESTTRKPKLLSAGTDVVTDTDDYCLVCHNSDASPPHQKFPNISVGSQYRFSRTWYRQMKHSTFFRASTVTEPVPDTAHTYDDNPYGKGKDISCLTCHRPHGSANEHMLKSPDDQSLCLACHDGTKAPDLRSFNTSGHGKAGVNRICQDCHFPHGTGQKAAVKTTITDPHTGTGNAADVNGAGVNEACFACHGLAGGGQAAYYSFNSSTAGWNKYYYLTGMGIDNSTYYSGGGSLKETQSTTTNASYAYAYTGMVAVQPSTTYSVTAYLNLPASLASGSAKFMIYQYNSSGGSVTNTTFIDQASATNGWKIVSGSLTTASSTTQVAFYLYLTGVGTAYWDEVQLAKSLPATYYQGKATYNSSIHKTSPSAHNPNDTSGAQPGDCDNCHNPHGKGNSYMTVDQDQALCYDCHNGTTPNTLSGKNVQAAFQMASKHDLTKVKCTNCHNVHMATQSVYLMNPNLAGGSISDRNLFCLGCHSGTMPTGVSGAPNVNTQWAGGGHNKANALTCSDCHESHGSQNANNLNYSGKAYNGYTAKFVPGMSFGARSFCEACHNRTGLGYKNAKMIPTGSGYVGQHLQTDSTPCSNCHTMRHNPTLGSYTGSSSFYSTACLTCHTQGVGNPYPATDADFNTPLNASDANARRSTHNITYNPPGTVDCVTCHGSNHEADHSTSKKVVDPDPTHPITGSLDYSVSSAFCLQCHDSTPVTTGGSTPPNILDTYTGAGHGARNAGVICSQCHTHHGSVNDKLLKTIINGSAVLPNYSGNNATVCAACHQGTDASLPTWPGFNVYTGSIHAFGNRTTGNLVQDGLHGPGACVNCHNPHGSRVEGRLQDSMLYKNGENLCYRCHASGFDNFSTPGDYNNKWNRFGSLLTIKKEGGTLHYGYNSFVAGTAVSDGVESLNSFVDKDCTITAKIKVKTFSTSTAGGVAQLGLSVYDIKNSSNYTKFFYRAHTSPNAYVVRYPNDGGTGTVITATTGDVYHVLKIVRRKSAGTLDTYVDNTPVRQSLLSTSGTFKVQLFCNLGNTVDSTPEVIDAFFKDFSVSYDDGTAPTRNTASGDDVQARFYMKSHHKVSDSDQVDGSKVECFDCHDPHTVTEAKMAYRNVSGKVMPIEADQDFCLKCHSANPPQEVKFPQDGTWDKSAYDSSAHGNSLKRYKGFGNYSNGLTIACKVCHNPHGSDQSHLQRESWDINRDGIPDDIDGDGILDSADKVGFVGYSTGTRKVMYVNITAGIPSRSAFRRVSTTIPYQGNGSIDINLCLNCHDGSPAPNVKKDFDKPYHHDVTYAEQVEDGGSKIECYNCHDQHRAQSRNDAAWEYPTTNPDAPREPMAGDAKFCLRCHDNSLPPGVSFGSKQLKNVKLSYNPYDLKDANGYDLITSYQGHFVQATGAPMMCRVCHNQHGSNYPKMLRDDTEPSKPDYDPSQPIQYMQSVALRPTDSFGGGDALPLSSPTERCLACHSGGTTYNGNLLPLPPPPDAAGRGFTMSPVGKHPDLMSNVTTETSGHIYRNTFAVITTPGSIKEECTKCHDSHDPYIKTVGGDLMDCYQCHNENTSLPDVQSEFNDNPTNPTRSKSIHPIKYDPSGTTPAYVECLKCHDQSKHMQGTPRLRKDPTRFDNYTSDTMVWAAPVASRTVNQFCLECHGQDTAVASSFWRGGAEHVPPRLPAAINGAHLQSANLLCTDCHEYHGSRNNGLRKNAKGDEETFCYSCHNNPANSQNGINIQAKFTGAGSRHKVDAAEQAAEGSKVECENCHNPHVVTRANPVVNSTDPNVAVTSDSAFCVGCHDSSGSNGVKFPGFANGTSAQEWDQTTGRWNKYNKAAYLGSQHDALGNVSCKKCHDPHGSQNSSMLLQNISSTSGISVTFGVHSTICGKRKEELGVNKVCSACHKGAMGVYNGYAGFTGLTFGKSHGVDKNCTYCHNPHGTGASKLIRSTKPLYMSMTSAKFGSVYNFKGFANKTTGAPYYSFCSSRGCHASERTQIDTFNLELPVDNFNKIETASSHHPIKEGVITCTSCHGEHGSSNAPDLRAPYFREGNWPKTWHSGRGVYSTYHRYGGFDGSNFFEMADGGSSANRNAVTTVSPPSNANDLCFMCHQQDDITGTATGGMTGTNTRFLGHEAVKGGAAISHDISRDSNGVGAEYHNFSCSTCHFPHSSSQGKLLKTSCMSQSDNQSPNSGYGTIFQCHAFTKWGNYNAGWRNLTTSSKHDFKRPPNAVIDLSASLDPDLTIHLSWTSVEDQPGQGAHHYNVYRYSQQITQAAKPYATRILKGLAGGTPGSAMSWTDTTGQPNTTYYYAVVACDSENNESLVSNSPQVALGPDTTTPTAIGDQQVIQVDGTYNVKISWHDPGDNVNVTQFKVYRKAGLTPLASGDIIESNRIATVSDTSQSTDGSPDANIYSYTDTVPQFGQEFSYAVIALDAAGNQSAVPTGAVLSITIIDPAPAAVSTLTVKPVSSSMSALLGWSAPTNQGAVSGYNVYRKAGSALGQSDLVSGNKIASLVSGLTYTDTSVPSIAADYYYAVTAVDASSGLESVLGNSVPVNIPAPPTGLTAAQGIKAQANLGFTAPAVAAGLNSYKVYYRLNSGAWQQAATLSKNLATNTGFEANLTGWNAYTLTAARDTSTYNTGLASVKLTGTSVGDKFIESASMVAVQPSTSFTWSGYVNVPSALSGGLTALRIIEYNSSGGYVTEHTATSSGVSLTSGWQLITDTWTTSATTTQVKLRVQLSGSGTAYWDDLKLQNNASTNLSVGLTGFQPGAYDFVVASLYNTYGGTTPYESVVSSTASLTVSDTQGPAAFAVSAALTSDSSYKQAALNWNAPADGNYTGFTPSGTSRYLISATYDRGQTWGTVFSTRLSNPSFESFTATIDDTTADTFTNWVSSAANIYAVSDSWFDGTALKMTYTGSGDGYISSAEPDTGQSVANKTYSASFWAKASKDTTFQYFIQANGGTAEWIGTTSPAIGTGWQRFATSGTFTSAATATSARVVIRPSSDTTASVTVDGVRLEAGLNALSLNDGSYYQPANCGTPGSPQSFTDPKDITAASAMYRVQAFDAQGCASPESYTATVYGRPSAITDLNVTSVTSQSANKLMFSTPSTLAGLSVYRIYAKNQSTALVDTADATLIGTITPARTSWDNMAASATAVSTPVDPNGSYYGAAKVNDGSTSTFWMGQAGTIPNIVTLTFQTSVPVLKVGFSFPYNGYQPKNFTLETYNGSTWDVQTTVTGNTNLSPVFTLPSLVTTNKLRISITDVGNGIAYYQPYIGEMMVYPGDSYVHDMHNAVLPAQPGLSYAYAVRAVDVNSIPSGMSSGSATVMTVVDKDGPAKVTDLAVTTDIGTNQATLTWSTPPDNLGLGTGTGAVGYQIYRSPLSSTGSPVAVTDSNYNDINNVALVYSGTYASTQAGAPNSFSTTWYDHVGAYYAVRSQDSSGNWSPISNSPFIVVGKDVQAPAPPVIESCTPKASPEVDIAWSPAVDNVCDTCGVNGYRLFRADVNIEPFLTDKCITENNIGQAEVAFNLIPYNYTTIADTGGVPGKTYYYALRAWDNEDNLSNISNCAIATVATTAADTTSPTWTGTPLTVSQQPYPDIDLNWTSASDTDNSSNPGTVDHYDIYRSLTTFSSKTDPGVTKIATVSGIRNSYIDRSGDHNTTYYYGIVAVDASANHNASVLSNIGSATVAQAPSPDNVKPSVPGSLAAATGVYPYINLSWTPSTDVDDASNTQPLLYYKLYRADYPAGITDANKDNASIVKTFIIAFNASSYDATGLGSAIYNYRLEAFDLAGNSSGLSNQVTGTVAAAPCVDTTAPTAPSNLAAIVGPSPDMALSWTASSDAGSCAGLIDHYNLYKATYDLTSTDLRTVTPSAVAGNSTTFTDSTGAPNTTYWYVLTAVDSSGNESGKSNVIMKTTAADTMAPAAIADLKASASAGLIQLTWCKPSDNVGVNHYEIYRKEQGTILTDADIITANRIATFTNAGTCLSYNDTGLASGHTYSYAVIAVDGSGNRSTISRGQASGDTIASLP